MLFKKNDRDHNVIVIGGNTREEFMPDPEVGKIYHGFDDGKIRLSRLVDWKIIKRIDLDKDNVSNYLLKRIQKEIKDCYWLYDPEQTIIFKAVAVDKEGKYDREIGYCYFLKTLSNRWFGAFAWLWDSLLDVDNRWYNELIKEN